MKKVAFALLALLLAIPLAFASPPKPGVKFNDHGPFEPQIDYRIDAVRDAGKKDIKNNPLDDKITTLVSGTKKFPLVMMQFPDQGGTYNYWDFDWLCFDTTNTSLNSLYRCYYNNSAGLLKVTGNSYGWWTSDSNKYYYSENHGTSYTKALVLEAAIKADLYGVNWAQYDNDNDGYVDAFLLVHSGPGAEEGDLNNIWSHRSSIPEYTTSTPWPGHPSQYIKIKNYTANPELQTVGSVTGLAKVGIFAHELGHAFGLPDLYDVGGSGSGLGYYCLMAAGSWGAQGGRPDWPTYMSAWPRIELGWINPTKITSSGFYLLPRNEGAARAYIVPTPWSSEYFLLENRQPYSYDGQLYQHGLYIYHIDTTIINNYRLTNTINTNTHAYGVALEEADAFSDTFALMDLFLGADQGSAYDAWHADYYGQFDSILYSYPPTTKSNYSARGKTGVAITMISSSSDTMYAWIDIRAGTGVEENELLVEAENNFIKLNSAYPNPVKNRATISYHISKTTPVTLCLYNLTGQLVNVLDNGTKEAGIHTVNLNSANLANGIYFYSLKASDRILTKKLVILK